MADYVCGRKVTHIRKDGTKQDSMAGVELPYEDRFVGIVNQVREYWREHAAELEEKKNAGKGA